VAKSAACDREMFINTNFGHGAWHMVPSPVQWQRGNAPHGFNLAGWSSGMIATANGQGLIQLAPGGYGDGLNECIRFGRVNRIPIAGASYCLQNAKYKTRVTVPNYPSVPGKQLISAAPTTSPSQLYMFNDLGDTLFSFSNVGNNLTINDSGGNSADGTLVDQWSTNNSAAQRFHLQPTGDGSWLFKNVLNGGYLTPVSARSGAGLVLKPLSNSLNQAWEFVLPPRVR
jgi:hypothetical protein